MVLRDVQSDLADRTSDSGSSRNVGIGGVFDASLTTKARHVDAAMRWAAITSILASVGSILGTHPLGAALVHAPLPWRASWMIAAIYRHLGVSDALAVVAEPLLGTVAVSGAALEARIEKWAVRRRCIGWIEGVLKRGRIDGWES